MIDLILQQLHSAGGPVLVALFAISVASGAVAIFKAVQFAQMGVGRFEKASGALDLWARGNVRGAIDLLREHRSPTGTAVLVAMSSLAEAPSEVGRAREMATFVALDQLNAMNRTLRLLEAVAQAAPMLGLLGTVIGMIEAFGELSAQGGAIDPAALAGGIWVALITTAAGLSVAIPVYFLSMWFEARVDHERASIDTAVVQVLYSVPAGVAEDEQTGAMMPYAAPLAAQA